MSNIDIATEQGEDATDDHKQLAALRARLRLRNWLLISGTGIVIAMFFFSWLSLFDLFGLDTRAEGLTMALGRNLDAQPLNEKIVLVPITAETEKEFGAYDRTWRRRHARAVDMLSQAGAKVVAFDFYLPEPSPYDEEFADAIHKAFQRGTRVVLGFRQLNDGKPRIVKKLGKAAAKLGALCVGERLGAVRSMPLVIQAGEEQPLPSLSLAIFSVDQGLDKISLDEESWSARQIRLVKSESSVPHVVHFSEMITSDQYQLGCPVIDSGDRVGELLIEVPSDKSLLESQQILSYVDLVTRNNNESLLGVKDKLVVIGLGTKADIHEENPGWTAPRLGIELHASALNSLLNGRAVRSAEPEVQFLLMLGLGVFGAFIRYWIPSNHRSWSRVLVLLAVAAYLVINISVYLKLQRLLNPVYHIGALLFAYTLANWIERKWFV